MAYKWVTRSIVILCVCFTLFSLLSRAMNSWFNPVRLSTDFQQYQGLSIKADTFFHRQPLDSLRMTILRDFPGLLPEMPGIIELRMPLIDDSMHLYIDLFRECGCPAKDFQLIRYHFQKGGRWETIIDTTLTWEEYQNHKAKTF